jgi:hypothetical protein
MLPQHSTPAFAPVIFFPFSRKLVFLFISFAFLAQSGVFPILFLLPPETNRSQTNRSIGTASHRQTKHKHGTQRCQKEGRRCPGYSQEEADHIRPHQENRQKINFYKISKSED